MVNRAETASGAYGLLLSGLVPPSWLVQAPSVWRPWTFRWEVLAPGEPVQRWDAQRALLRLLPSGYVEIDLPSATSTLHVTGEPRPDEMLHPYLGSTAAIVAHWDGRNTFHAGSFVHDDGVWAILGDREHGKSSALAWLAAHGYGVFADDLLITSGGTALAGPRCLDLREGAAEHFGIGVDIGMTGTRRRWRVGLPPVPPELPLRGWISLRWSDEVRVRSLATAERFAQLVRNRGVKLTEGEPAGWLDLLRLPMFELSRPRDWLQADHAMQSLLNGLRSSV